MSNDAITCIVPVFNGEKYLRETLTSILNQTYAAAEILIVDDGSTDCTASIADSYGAPVRRIYQANGGVQLARNLGIDEARGDFIAFLDADDLWHPEKLERQMARFRDRPELDLCLTHLQNFWVPELRREAEAFRNHRLARPMPGYSTIALLARRSLFERAGRFDEALRHGGPADWFLRVRACGATVEILPEVLAYRRLHHSNLSRARVTASREEHLRVLKAHLDRSRRASPQKSRDPEGSRGA